MSDGSVYCWGSNSSGRLGNGTTTASPVAVKVADVTGVFTNSGVTSVTAGGSHTCAVSDGSVYCWGSNSNGRLGDGTTTDSPVAVKVADVTGVVTNSGVTSVSAGGSHTCAVVDGSVYCWARNHRGQLGNATKTESLVAVKVCCSVATNDEGGQSSSGGVNPPLPDPITTTPATTAPTGDTPAPVLIEGLLPKLAVGDLVVIEDGQRIDVEVFVENDTELVVQSSAFELRLSGECAGEACAIDTTPEGTEVLTFEVGGAANTQGEGFEPGSRVDVWLFSEPRYLGQVIVRADGTFAGEIDLGDIDPGEHTLQVTGLSQTGAQRSANLGVVVNANEAASPGGESVLPTTGSSPARLWLVALVLVGLGLAANSRRRVTGVR